MPRRSSSRATTSRARSTSWDTSGSRARSCRSRASTGATSPGDSAGRRCSRRAAGVPGAGARAGDRSGVHPVEFDPDLRERMRAAGQVERFERELAEIVSRVDGHNRSLGREFDRVVDVLTRRGYIARSGGNGDDAWSLTAKGTMLASVFHESDLLIAECMSFGFFDGVDAAGARRTAVDVRVRAPQPGTAGAAVVRERPGAEALAQHPGRERGPRGRRAVERAGRAPSARSGLLRGGPRLDGRSRASAPSSATTS